MLLISLFFTFAKIGFASFGGLSMIPIINAEMLSHGWMTLEEVGDIVAIAEMTPGSLGINSATFVGMRTAGPLGALVATLGVMVPSLTLCLIAAHYFKKLKGNALLESGLYGIRPICLGMIAATTLSLSKSNFIAGGSIYWQPIIIAIIIGILLFKFKFSIPKVIAVAAGLGILIA